MKPLYPGALVFDGVSYLILGTWIETLTPGEIDKLNEVVPYIGTWIETERIPSFYICLMVVPYIGTWIETGIKMLENIAKGSRTLYRYVD